MDMGSEILDANIESASTMLKALSNPRRLKILCLLHSREMTVSELQDYSGLSQSAVSQQLAILRNDSIVVARRDAQSMYYRIESLETSAIIEALNGIYC